MKVRVVFAGAFLLAVMIMTAPYAFGCSPEDDGVPARCVLMPRTTAAPTDTIAAVQVAAVNPVAKPIPKGDRPETAREPMYVRPEYCIEEMCPGAMFAPALTSQGAWTWIDPNSTTWYKLDDGHSLQIKLWLFANGQSGLGFDVYAPDQKDLYGKPIGRGSKDRFQPSDLFYSGRTQAGGIWYVKVINNNPHQVWYSLRFTRTIPYMANTCDSCHKPMGSLMFDQCTNGAGSTWCQDLEWLYNQNPTTFDHSIPG